MMVTYANLQNTYLKSVNFNLGREQVVIGRYLNVSLSFIDGLACVGISLNTVHLEVFCACVRLYSQVGIPRN